MRNSVFKVLVPTLILATCVQSRRGALGFQQSSRVTSETGSFSTANSTAIDYERSNFDFEVAGCRFEVKSSGRGKKTCGSAPPQRFRLLVDRDVHLSHLHFFVKGETLYLIEEVEDFESAGGTMRAYQLRTMKRLWSRLIPAFNISPALVEGNHAYLSGIGFVAKLDLMTGRFLWKKLDLYEKMDFDEPLTPIVEGTKVTFPTRAAGSLTFDKRSGKMLSRL